MVICKFYAAGNCRYGDSCRFEHVNPRFTYHNHNPQKPANPTKFSFTKSLQKVEQQQQQQQQYRPQQPPQWQQMSNSNQNPVRSFFGGQAPANNKPRFSFNQTFNKVFGGSSSVPTNVLPQQSNLQMIQEIQMDGDNDPHFVVQQSSDSPFRNQNQNNFVHSSRFVDPKNQNHTNQASRSFFGTTTTQNHHQQQHQTSNHLSSQNPNDGVKHNDSKVPKSNIYTPISQLSGADLANFKADKFHRPIPICAPPLEVCF